MIKVKRFCKYFMIATTILFFLNISRLAKAVDITCPSWTNELDVAGYSDVFLWGIEDGFHQYGSHELLSGEWAAAVYYDGIETEPIYPAEPNGPHKSMWLTHDFLFPYWTTNSDFVTLENPTHIDNPNNPTIGYDTGYSAIGNNQIRIDIDYEVVDLQAIDPNGWCRSPLAFWDKENNCSAYALSSRWIMLQTYTITNLSEVDTISNIEFYQMLHSHGANEYAAYVNSVYQDFPYYDPLENYTPYNPVHTVGKFCYDITQWNKYPEYAGTANHKDWCCFSSTIEPDMIENGFYTGGHNNKPNNKPPEPGTHWNIEERNLNCETSQYMDEVAGAFGWYFGSLDPEESVSVTVAVMFGHGDPVIPSLELTKEDDVQDCLDPSDSENNTITYTICYSNPVTDPCDPDYLGDVENVTIVDYLPVEINPLNVTASDGGAYDPFSNTVTWSVGTLSPGESDCVTLTVEVMEVLAEPNGVITNLAVMETDIGYLTAEENTPICCWCADGIIYVDRDAGGYDNGTSWENAYLDLQRALWRARGGCGSEIWVAEGAYKPTNNPGNTEATFDLPDGSAVYGGFIGNETIRNQRNWMKHTTILSGIIGDNHCDNVVTIDDANDVILDGFMVLGASEAGIHCENNDNTIEHNTIRQNGSYGIYCLNSLNTNIKNNWVHNNNGDGIYLSVYSTCDLLRNNTIVANDGYGINALGTDPNAVNIIFWKNNSQGYQFSGCNVTYSCYKNPGDPNSVIPDPQNGNIHCDPCFIFDNYDDPNTCTCYLDLESPCIDLGDPCGVYTGEYDINADDRLIDGDEDGSVRVDMGADEFSGPVCYDSPADFNEDGIVDLFDFSWLAAAWLSQPGDGNWNDICDLESDEIIELLDLELFSTDWLMMSCEYLEGRFSTMAMGMEGGMGMMGMMSMDGVKSAESISTIETVKSKTNEKEAKVTTLAERIKMRQELIKWAKSIWYEDERFRRENDEKEWWEFVRFIEKELYFLKLKKMYLDLKTPKPSVKYDPKLIEEYKKARLQRETMLIKAMER